MRLALAPVLLIASALAAFAEDLRELPEDARLPPAIEAALTSATGADEILDRVMRWEGELSGDATPDQLVQAAIAFPGGGNAFYLKHWIFVGAGDSFSSMIPVELSGGILSARTDGGNLVLTLYRYLDGDPRCCPSGTEEVRLPLK